MKFYSGQKMKVIKWNYSVVKGFYILLEVIKYS